MKVKPPHILYHILFWIIIIAAFAISEWSYRVNLKEAIIFELLFLPTRLVAVYVNWFVLIPKYLYKNRFAFYFLLLFLLLFIVGIAQRYLVLYWGYPTFFPQWVTDTIEPFDIPRLFQAILIIVSPVAFTTGFKLFLNWYKGKEEAEKLKQEKKEAELKFLKTQTNPHFLFNSLNSIYGLALGKSDKAPGLILKLSDILSFSLYEANAKSVSLEKEVQLIENIIELEKERFGKRVEVTFEKKGDFSKIEIPPLILMPLVENAFKHGVKDEVNKGRIHIEINVDGTRLFFKIENTIPENNKAYNKAGLGLNNVSRRLDLLYQNNKKFEVTNLGKTFKVTLEINQLNYAT